MPIASRVGFWFIKPTPPPPPPPGPPVNPTPVAIIADYVVADYVFPYGFDLDTRTKMFIPTVGGDYVGWSRATQQSDILYWGGDNRGTGVESVLINIENYRTDYPDPDTFRVDFNCYWYSRTSNAQPVKLVMTMYTGGVMVKSGYTWTNPTATSTVRLTTASKIITTSTIDPASDGEPLGYLTYNVVNGVGSIDIYE